MNNEREDIELPLGWFVGLIRKANIIKEMKKDNWEYYMAGLWGYIDSLEGVHPVLANELQRENDRPCTAKGCHNFGFPYCPAHDAL